MTARLVEHASGWYRLEETGDPPDAPVVQITGGDEQVELTWE